MSGSERTVAFFCVVDGPGYLPKAITALRSVARFHPNADYYVLGRFGDDADAMAMLAEHGLKFKHLDLSEVYLPTLRLRPRRFARRHPGTSWPSECFWWFDAPELLAEMGYGYSCALDGDTLCVAPLDLDDVFDGRSPVAGVEIDIGVINSGVLFLDHARALEFGLSDRARKVYETVTTCEHPECTGFCRTRGDQGILVELERGFGLEVRRVGNTYNHKLTWSERAYLERNTEAPFGIDESHILHLLSKPWRPPSRRGRLPQIMCDGYATWWRFARELWTDDTERERHFGREYEVEPGRSLVRLAGRRRAATAAR